MLGNQKARNAVGALSKGIEDVEPLVRGASAWALGELASEAARQILTARQAQESDAQVQDEIANALRDA